MAALRNEVCKGNLGVGGANSKYVNALPEKIEVFVICLKFISRYLTHEFKERKPL